MLPTPEKLLECLPPFRNDRVLIKQDQRVNDIIKQLLIAHEKYAHYYDCIAGYFDAESVDKICSNIHRFLTKYIQYREESDREQTTALPSALLSLKFGDCKHYSLFAAGILDALKRQGKNLKWCYRFCSYKIADKTPHHVFVVVKKSDGGELWIDAVPGADQLTPVWQVDETVKNFDMPLYDVVGSIENNDSNTIGYTFGEKLAHSAAKVNPLFVAGRGAFLLMLKNNVRAWAKNIQDLTTKYGAQASDPIGKRWYLFGGDSVKFWEAVAEGSKKRMIGNAQTVGVIDPVSITAMITAAAPIVLAMVGLVKSLSGKQDWDGQTALYPTGGGGTGLPINTGSPTMDFLKSPIVLAGGAALAYYLYTRQQTRRKVNGTSENFLLLALLTGGLYLHYKSKQTPSTTQPVAEQLLLTDATPIDNNGEPVRDTASIDENNYFNDGNSGGYGYGGDGYKYAEPNNQLPIEAMM